MDFFEKGYYLDFEGDILKNWNQVFFRETPFFDSYVSDEKFIERHFDKNLPLCKWFSKENFNEMIEDCKKDFFSNDLEVFIFSVVNVLIDDNNYEIVDAIKNYLMDNLIFENDCDKFIEFFNESHKKTDINETYKRFLESTLLKNLLEKLYLLIKE